MNHDIVDAISYLIREKQIEKHAFQEIIESVFLSILKKKFGSSDNFDVIFNLEKGDIEIYCEKEIVPDDGIEDPVTQVALSDAQKVDGDFEVGEDFVEIIDYRTFGRRLITAAKQNLAQKIKEVEKDNIFREFTERKGEVILGDVHQINRHEIRINVDKTEVVMPRDEAIYNERYRRGDTVRAIIKDVARTPKEPLIIVSRADVSFIRRLFEIEVPEIYDGIVEIRRIVREPGDRTKIAVESNDKRIDPVGACVGLKGVRIQAIVRELNNEKIDIIHWNEERSLLIHRALAPVTPLELIPDEENRRIMAVIPDDQMSMAIGRKGQNIRLASLLVGVNIEPIKESDFYEEEELPIDEIEGLSDSVKGKLKTAGYDNAEQVLDAGKEKLLEISGVGEAIANKILEALTVYYED
ncbi:transcription termination factor NusA [candidate division LCP-89 bacterium B3_LCP]|uniref:Transcription termination/antitermination protein NusA n=1 Tax=candidate division LCP-89 bacterium B3_LCP TaxID=2012998 RepID=A0A532V3H4_UNCL8|nr:MAG: transcription termination factor NusA [candidate division LCP-89 bacterium B3_LCP]